MTIDTACSGSLVSVDVACRYLSSGEIDGAIIGGANLYLRYVMYMTKRFEDWFNAI